MKSVKYFVLFLQNCISYTFEKIAMSRISCEFVEILKMYMVDFMKFLLNCAD